MREIVYNGVTYNPDDADELFGTCLPGGEMEVHICFDGEMQRTEFCLPVSAKHPVSIKPIKKGRYKQYTDVDQCIANDWPAHYRIAIDGRDYVYSVQTDSGMPLEEIDGDCMTAYEYVVCLQDPPNERGERQIYEICWRGEIDYDAVDVWQMGK